MYNGWILPCGCVRLEEGLIKKNSQVSLALQSISLNIAIMGIPDIRWYLRDYIKPVIYNVTFITEACSIVFSMFQKHKNRIILEWTQNQTKPTYTFKNKKKITPIKTKKKYIHINFFHSNKKKLMFSNKIDGDGPINNWPNTDHLHHFVQKNKKK